MTTKALPAFTGAILAVFISSAPSEAGSGVRLGFGYPLGSFVATPARGGYAVPTAAYATEKCPKKGSAAQLARSSRSTESKVASKQQGETSKVAALKTETSDKSTETETSNTSSTEPALTGSKALAGTDAQSGAAAPEGEKTAAAKSTETEPAGAGSEPVVEATPAAKADESSEDKDVGCKKFVPAIGVTVSVGCDK